MKTRIITAVVALPLLAVCLFLLPEIVITLVLCAACAVSAWELLHNTHLVKNLRACLYSAATAFAVPLWCYFGMPVVWADLGVLILFCLLFMEIMLSGMRIRFEKAALCMAGAFLIPYMLSGVVRILGGEYGRWNVAVPFVIAFASDSGAFFAGKFIGRHKMAPVMSPHKTWEGLFGGIAASILGMVLFTVLLDAFTTLRVSYLLAVIYGVLGALIGAFGDLCFSVIKRQTGIKDYGTILPGHGGILDRFDSFLAICLLVEFLLQVLPLGIV